MDGQQESRLVRFVAAGDVFVRRADPRSMFSHVAETLRGADIAFVNQEVPLCDGTNPWPGKVGIRLFSPPEAVEALTYAGIDVVALASNHTLDFGREGMLQTLEVLDAAGIAHAGAGGNIDQAHEPALLERNGTRVAILAYNSVFTPGYEATDDRPGISTVRVETTYSLPRRAHEMPGSPAVVITTPDQGDVARMEADVRAVRQRADVVVVSWHWGVSGGYQHLVPYQVELGRRAIDAGADLVVGHHIHSLQGIEVYRGKAICYNLGGFGFDFHSPTHAEETALLECVIRDGTIDGLFLHPGRILPDGSARLVQGEEAADVVAWIRRLCRPLGTVLTQQNGRLRVELSATASG